MLAMVLGSAHGLPAAEPVTPREAMQTRTLSPVTVVSPADGRVPEAPTVPRDERPSWMQSIRACGPAEKAAARKHPLGADPIELGKIVAAEGRLTPGPADCTLIGCKCCNSCGFDWVVVPRHDCPDRRFRIQRKVDARPLNEGASDCDLGRMGAYAMEVLAIGRIAGNHDLIEEAELCRIDADQLNDADYKRLMSNRSRKETVDMRRCKPRSPPPPPAAPPPRPWRFGDLL